MKNILETVLKIDTKVYLRLHGLNKNKMLHLVMKYLTHLGSTPFGYFYGGLIFASIYLNDQKLEALLISIILSQTIVHILKRLINRPRPYRKMILETVKNPPKCVYSFPSGHTAVGLTTSLGAGVIWPSLMPVFLVVAVGVGLSRIVLGYHYPVDVFFGGLIAFGIHVLSVAIFM